MRCANCDTPVAEGSRLCLACGSDPSSPDPSRPGGAGDRAGLERTVASHYRVERLLGRGGMGSVYLARDLKLDRLVAIKVLDPVLSQGGGFVRRFEREARTAARLDHHHIIPIYAVEIDGDLKYFVMKYIAGECLTALQERHQPFPLDRCQRLLWEAASALGHAHSRGVVHRDVKPGNIMVDEDGAAVLADFGIAKALEAATQLTVTGHVLGTPHYMSPEQGSGAPLDGRADQYSLACVGYHLLTGQVPFHAESVHPLIQKHALEEPTPIQELRRDVPRFLGSAIQRAMAKAPDDRFPTMEDFATAVWPERPLAPAGAPQGMAAARDPGGRRRGPGASAVAVAASFAVLVALGGVYVLLRPAPRADDAAA
ncbi:MAG: serine/threonine-protein kinase, partial [Gemmatimonadales bacterium]